MLLFKEYHFILTGIQHIKDDPIMFKILLLSAHWLNKGTCLITSIFIKHDSDRYYKISSETIVNYMATESLL